MLGLGKEIKKHIEQDNMLGWQYNTVGVSDGITMGGEGTHYAQQAEHASGD